MPIPLSHINGRRNAASVWRCFWLASCIVTVFCSCKNHISVDVSAVNRQLQAVDSILLTHNSDAAITLLLALEKKYAGAPVPFMSKYYRIRANQSRENPHKMDFYADSAVAVFNNPETAMLFPAEYVEALVVKGESCKVNQKFNLALQFYYKAEKLPNISSCSKSLILSKIAGIYYDQENYVIAGRLWYAAYLMLDSCNDDIPQKLFMVKQGTLDNAGLAYDKAGYLDSAAICYQTDVMLVNKAYPGMVDSNLIKPSKRVVYDNLGGLYIKKGMPDSAEYYLEKAVAITYKGVDAIVIPPLLKLADLYTQTGDLTKAERTFEESRALIDKYSTRGHTPDSKTRWHRLYAAYLFKKGSLQKAYSELDIYIHQKDSLDRANKALKALNVGKEFSSLEQQHTLEELKIKETVNNVYLWAIALGALLSAVIIFLAYRNLHRSRKSHRDAVSQNKDLEKALQELEAANKNYMRVMRVMAHDLRNPLGGITGIAALLRQEDMGDEAKRMAQLIEATGNHSMEMINELLRSGLAEESEPIEVQRLDVSPILHDTVELLQFKAKEKKQELVFENSNGPVYANINQEKLWRVFNNVIVNAIKFTPGGGTIKVRLYENNRRAIITVEDNGIGIPENDKTKVFDMFTEAKKPGTGGEKPFGLGLSISKRIMSRHKGSIWFESTPGKGTIFYIELPAAT